MTRRIVLTVLALITALQGIIAVPLGLITAGQDRRDFRDETLAAATTLANVGLWTGNPDIDAPHSLVDLAARQELDYDGKFMANWAPPTEGNWIIPHGQF